MSGSSNNEVPITELPPQHLNQLNQQLEQELEFMTGSLQQLKDIQSKFVQSQECLNKINKDNNGKEILVPLTSSMYITGELDDVERVLLDVGTGYYIEKDVEGAKSYFKKKIEYLTKQMEKIQPTLQEKYKMKQAVMETLQSKVQQQMASQTAAQQQAVKSS